MGFDLGGILKSFVNPTTLLQLATGPAGWASLAAQTIMSAVAQQVISQIGKQLGLPPAVIDMAQQAFTAASGGSGGVQSIQQAVSSVGGLSTTQQGEFTRQAEKGVKRLVDTLMENDDTKSAKYAGKANKNGKGGANGANGASPSNTTGSNSLLMTIALALGQAADKKLVRMGEIAKQIGATEDGKNQNKITEMGAELQALGQEMSILSSALTNALRSIGEANSQIARKS